MKPLRHLFAVACVVVAGATLAAPRLVAAQGKDVPAVGTKAPVRSLEAQKNVFSCKPMVLGQGVPQADGGMLEIPQGWINRAEIVANGDTTSLWVRCHYGIDKGAPANRPAHFVNYTVKGFRPSQCAASAGNIWCKTP